MALVRRCVGRGGGIAHLEGVAIVFVDQEVRTCEGDVVVELCAVLVDMVPIWEQMSLERTSRDSP